MKYKIGARIMQKAAGREHAYVLKRTFRHMNRHGFQVKVLEWEGKCAVCDAPFVATTSSGGRRRYMTRNCLQHRRPAPGGSKQGSRLCQSLDELEHLLNRLAEIVPIARQQWRKSEGAAMMAYFDSDKPSEAAKAAWRKTGVMCVRDLVAIEFPIVDTPETQELRSIGLAVAAFGGADAISRLGWMLVDRGQNGQALWSAWDGMAGHWL
jgi:hypothetical protein